MADLAVQDVELRRIFADESDGNENYFEGFSANEIMRDNFDNEIADYIDEHDPENEANDDQMRAAFPAVLWQNLAGDACNTLSDNAIYHRTTSALASTTHLNRPRVVATGLFSLCGV